LATKAVGTATGRKVEVTQVTAALIEAETAVVGVATAMAATTGEPKEAVAWLRKVGCVEVLMVAVAMERMKVRKAPATPVVLMPARV